MTTLLGLTRRPASTRRPRTSCGHLIHRTPTKPGAYHHSANAPGLLVVLIPRRDDPYLAEVPVPGKGFSLRLLTTSNGALQYDWKPSRITPWLSPSTPQVPPIHLSLSGVDQRTGYPGRSFLFRAVDDRGRYVDSSVVDMGFDFVESTGFVFRRFGFADYPHWGTYGLTRSALPRRDKVLTIRMKAGAGSPGTFDMLVSNPAYVESVVEWTPEPLPITRQQGALIAHLREMKYHPSGIHEGHVQYRIVGESTDTEWQNPSFSTELEDATGNRGSDLSPFEPAWKVIAHAYRNPKAAFRSDLVSAPTKLVCPAPATVQTLDRFIEVAGRKFRLLCISGAGTTEEQGGKFTAKSPQVAITGDQLNITGGFRNGANFVSVTSGHPCLWVEPEAGWYGRTRRGDQLVVQQILPNGTLGTGPGNHYFSANNRELLVFQLPGSDAGELHLQGAINRPERFEFTVAPPDDFRKHWQPPDGTP